MVEIMYQPRMDDEVCVARFETMDEAKAYMEKIKVERPKAYPHHRIKE